MFEKFCLFFFFFLSIHHWSEGKDLLPKSDPIVLIVDTDVDLDDMMAILYLLKVPQIDLKAITTVGTGMARWEYGAQNLSNLLELAGQPRIPVAYGARRSLSPSGTFPTPWRNEADEVMKIKLPKNSTHPVRVRASQFMVDLIKNSPSKVTLLCLGPLTNIANALKRAPEIKQNLERIYIAGGAIMVPGNIIGRPQGFRNRVAEYNVFLDAKASQDVFDSGVPLTLIPLDITQSVPITKKFFEQLSNDRETPSANFVYEVIKPYTERGKRSKSHFCYSLAAALMTHPHLATYRDFKLTINLKKGTEYGRIMVSKSGQNIRVPTLVDTSAFYKIFLETLNRPPHLKPSHNESR